MDSRDREDVVHRALRALPTPRAPGTLLPRVMAAVRQREEARPAPARTWFTWPWWAQTASATALLAVVAGILWIWPAMWDASAGSAGAAWQWVQPRAFRTATAISATVRVLIVLWESLLQPLALYALVWIVVMAAACAAFGAAIGRVALGGASHS